MRRYNQQRIEKAFSQYGTYFEGRRIFEDEYKLVGRYFPWKDIKR